MENKTILDHLVIGSPRSGFTLTIGIINELKRLYAKVNCNVKKEGWKIILRNIVDLTSKYNEFCIKKIFTEHHLANDLVYNGEFHLLVGGPKWLDNENKSNAGIRKYIGVKGKGDFLLNTYYHKEILEYYDVVHSHVDPKLWLNDEYFQNYKFISSVRNPLGIINSSCFSLNAMASEYIQKYNNENLSQDFIRQRHGLYKLSDLNFFEGICKYYIDYFKDYFEVKDKFAIIKWEELIGKPQETIKKLSQQIGLPISSDDAYNLWKPMDHKNTLLYHKHNYRRGKGIVGDWKNSLVNEHFEIMKSLGFDKCLEILGYPKIEFLNISDYSPYQKLVAAHIQRGEIYTNVGDKDLFGFAFNKSNIDASKFNFKSLPKRKWTHVERTTLTNDEIVHEISECAELIGYKLNEIFKLWIGVKGSEVKSYINVLKEINVLFNDLPYRNILIDNKTTKQYFEQLITYAKTIKSDA